MCYDVAYLTKRLHRYAKHYGTEKDWDDIGKRLPPTFHTNAFEHADLPVVTNSEPEHVQLFTWGLIPSWVKDVQTATKISNNTLNARGEEMFNKPSYKSSAKSKRCLVIVDGFYEHHWLKDKSYPHFIHLKDDEPMALAGLWSTWKLPEQGIEKNTVSIVTSAANPMMQHIHNRPKGSEGPRMPLILSDEEGQHWLHDTADHIPQLVKPFDEKQLEAYTVPRLRGKAYPGNVKEVMQPHRYEELDSSQGTLF